MKRIPTFFFIIFLSLCQLEAQNKLEEGQTYVLAGIDVKGNSTISSSTIISRSGLQVGMEITLPGTDLARAIKKLWESDLVSDIEIKIENIVGNQAFILIRVEELPIVVERVIVGTSKGQESDLQEKLQFLRASKWTKEREMRVTRIIKNFFIKKGYYNTKVNFLQKKPQRLKKGTIRLEIIVDRGAKMKIDHIWIEGNQDFSDKRLKKQFKDTKEKRFWRLWKRSKYTPGEMEDGKQNLLSFYQKNGYRDAELISDTVTIVGEKALNVFVKVKEGEQYYIRNLTFSGNLKYSSDTLMKIIGVSEGEVYNSELLTQRLTGDPSGRDVGSLYMDDGHLFYNARVIERAVEGNQVDLEIRIFEGPQATIRKVIVEGNSKTSDHVILRELRVLPGMKFSRSALIRSQREILNLGYFNQENMQVIPIPDPATGFVDIKFIVEEKPSDQLQLQGGYSAPVKQDGRTLYGGFVGTFQIGFNNFSTYKFFEKGAWSPLPSGDGQKLSFSFQSNGAAFQTLSFSFLEPWFGGKKPNSLGVNVFYSRSQLAGGVSNYRLATIGTSIDYGRRLSWPDDFFRSYTSLSYRYYDMRNAERIFPSLNISDAFINIISLKQTIDRTSIDAPLFPRSGSQISLSIELTPPYSLLSPGKNYADVPDQDKYKFLEFYKWKFSSNWYFSIWKNLVLRPRMEFAYLGTYNQDYGISPFERFQMGGSGLAINNNLVGLEYIPLRGYDVSEVGPFGLNTLGNFTALGGNIYSKYSLELRYPITLNPASSIWAVAFAEAGNTWLGVENFNPFSLKRTVGAGVRVMLPMVGLMGVDFGYGFDDIAQNPGVQRGWVIQFILGREP